MAYNDSGTSLQKSNPAVFNLIIINVLVFLVQMLLDGPNKVISTKLSIYNYKSALFEPYQIITNLFAHGSISHIVFNMFTLYTFGIWLERTWGTKKFLIFYFTCGIVAGLCQMLFFSSTVYVDSLTGIKFGESALGASGAIMGLFGAFAYLFPNTPLYMFFIPIPIKAKYMMFIMAGIDLFGGLRPGQSDGIGHYAHLSGLLMGLILVIYWNKTNRNSFY